MVCCHYLISGHVQGVGFRHFTYKTAVELGLVGWVRNLSDGRVEALAQGNEDQHLEFEKRVRIGPRLARVSNVDVTRVRQVLTDVRFRIADDEEMPWQSRV